MKYTTIAESCDLHARIGWQGLTKKEYLDEGDYYLVTGVDFDNGHIAFDRCHYVTQSRYEQDTHIQLKLNDVLVTKDGTIGKVALIDAPIDKPATLNSGVFVVRPIDSAVLNPKYLMCVLTSGIFSRFIEKIKVGCTIAHLNQEKFLKFSFPLPDIDEQQHIVQIFDNLKLAIDCRTRQLEMVNRVISSRFSEMFGDIADDASTIETRRLGDVAQVGSSHRVFTKEFVDHGIPFYRGTEIGELADGHTPENPFRISEEHYHRLAADETKPQIGDLLMPSICNRGQVWMVDTEEPFYYKDGRVLCISPNREIFEPVYLQYYMRKKTEIEYPKLGSGSTFAEFKIFLLKDMEVRIPSMEMQIRFAKFVENMNESRDVIRTILEKLYTLQASLSQQFFG